ncbi:hypothetical protein NDU88_000970 [Pleurodeles waltl]|uniref:Uncharacterized protein n=1 Tax=Pleurodeles waltl TaxID=8319 RepID=A0AAV7Q2P2_PLEWA|nr:hypothetical protein NDU88_000970 [Pleurodeles waltl]
MTPSVCPGGGVLCYLPRARCPDGWRRGAPRLVWDWPADGRAGTLGCGTKICFCIYYLREVNGSWQAPRPAGIPYPVAPVQR